MIVRRADDRDVVGIRSVSLAAGQGETDSGADADYVRLLLRTGQVLVGEDAGSVVAWGATKATAHGSMLTDLFVSPAHQGRGIGQRLLAQLWPDPAGPQARFTFSSQHVSALPLYVRAGLTPFWPLLYLAGAPARLAPVAAHVSRVSSRVAAKAEAGRTGVDRGDDYAYWTRHQGSSAFLIHQDDRLVAAGAADPAHILHLCVLHDDLADVAVLAALGTLESTTAMVCLPGPHPALMGLLRQGFRIDEYDTCMSSQAAALPVTFAYSPGLA